MEYNLGRRLAAEFFGTFWLVFGGCGSAVISAAYPQLGIGFTGVALAFGLTVLTGVYAFGPISGGHFNPAVSLVFTLRRELAPGEAAFYAAAQIAGGVAGTLIAHLMFALPLVETSLKARTGGPQWFAEWVATFGLIVTILLGIRFARASVPWLVGLYITAAYWFTASTSFANPAVAIARALTNTFSGIRPLDLPGFIAAELIEAGDAEGVFAKPVAGPGGFEFVVGGNVEG